MKIDKKLIQELTDYLNEFKLSELEYGDNNTKIKVSKINPSIYQNANEENKKNSADKIIESETLAGTKVTSPIIGTAYTAPEPGAKKFVEVGKKIKKGDTIMIVEAMKTMNHIPSPQDGTVKKICIEDGQPVEYGQLLILLD
tara:strand:- start:43 stop:468 length:426 start_codon:yes stop_codon:yes gene_type:complete